MRQYTRRNLNVKRLLELGDLDIRGVAAQSGGTSANKFFDKVEQFIKDAPQLRDILMRSPSVEGSEDELENIKDMLNEIGCNKLNADIYGICGALKAGDTQATGKLVSDAVVKFNALTDRLALAYTARKFQPPQSADANAESARDTILLKEALEYLDYEEANRKLRVLAVDDVTVVLNTIASVLSPYYEVFALKNSSHIEKFLAHTTPELFLLDIEMNEISGFDLVPVIRKFEKHQNTPIIFLTGNASVNNIRDAIALGACDFITKPVNKDILLEKIQRNIVRKKAY